jgi:protein O-mannosyl-transferase
MTHASPAIGEQPHKTMTPSDKVSTTRHDPFPAWPLAVLLAFVTMGLYWPAKLAVFYPYPGVWPLATVLLAGGSLLGISVVFFVLRCQPYLLMGWLWFVGTLVPVIGLVQVGAQAMADRYAYVPSLGVFVLIVWGACDLIPRRSYRVMALSATSAAAIILCFVLTWRQLGYWQNSETLYRHALAVTENNDVAHVNLGIALHEQGRLDDAISQYQEAIRLKPGNAKAHYNLAIVLDTTGRTEEAIGEFQEVLRLKVDRVDVHYNLGSALARAGRLDEAIAQCQEALRLQPDFDAARRLLSGIQRMKNAPMER